MYFDLSNFYSSITENLPMAAIYLAKNYCTINDQKMNTIKQSQKHILFHDVSIWSKKDNPNFSIAMGASDSAEDLNLFIYYYCGDFGIILIARQLICTKITELSS